MSINLIKDLIIEDTSPLLREDNFSYNILPWDKDLTLSITYFVKDKEAFPNDIFQEELDNIKYLGAHSHVGIGYSPDYSKYRVVYALEKNLNFQCKLKKCLKVVYRVISDYLRFKDYAKKEVNNGELNEVVTKKVITYLFRNILKEDYFCEFNYHNLSEALIITKGKLNAIKEVEKHLLRFKKNFSTDKEGAHEIETVIESLENMDYRDLYIIYTGSLRFIDEQKETVCELDGIIFTPYNQKFFLKVIEAKRLSNKHHRANVALEQLRDKFSPIIDDELFGKVDENEILKFGGEFIFKKIK